MKKASRSSWSSGGREQVYGSVSQAVLKGLRPNTLVSGDVFSIVFVSSTFHIFTIIITMRKQYSIQNHNQAIILFIITMMVTMMVQYSIRVSAENALGEGEPSGKQTVKTLQEAPEGF